MEVPIELGLTRWRCIKTASSNDSTCHRSSDRGARRQPLQREKLIEYAVEHRDDSAQRTSTRKPKPLRSRGPRPNCCMAAGGKTEPVDWKSGL